MSPAISLGSGAANPGDRRFRIVSVPPGEDWRKLVAPSPPANDRPPAPKLTAEHLAAIEHAVRIAAGKRPQDRQGDLRQALAEKLLTWGRPIKKLEAWCVTCSRRLLIDESRKVARQRRILKKAYDLGAPCGYEKRTWYPPHKDAEEFAPFACKEARVMHVKRTTALPDVETALVDAIDKRAEHGIGPKRTATSDVERDVERTIREKCLDVKNYAEADRVRASSLRGRT